MGRSKNNLSLAPRPSTTLLKMIDSINKGYGKLKLVVMEAYNQAILEDFTPEQAKKLLLEKVEFISQTTIYRYLPDEAKGETGRPKSLPVGKLVQPNSLGVNMQASGGPKIIIPEDTKKDVIIATLKDELLETKKKVSILKNINTVNEIYQDSDAIGEDDVNEIEKEYLKDNPIFPEKDLEDSKQIILHNYSFAAARQKITVFNGNGDHRVNIWMVLA